MKKGGREKEEYFTHAKPASLQEERRETRGGMKGKEGDRGGRRGEEGEQGEKIVKKTGWREKEKNFAHAKFAPLLKERWKTRGGIEG